MKKSVVVLCAMMLVLGVAGMSAGELLDRGGGLIYDTDLNITWLQNANLASTNTFGVTGIVGPDRGDECGLMMWDTAKRWIAAMNAANYLGFSNWRLPTTPGTDAGFTSEGEMGHLFFDLGELVWVPGVSITVIHNSNYNLFINILQYYYWYGTEYAPVPGNAWVFNFSSDYQYVYGEDNTNCAVWAVRDGDVAPVPEPATMLLLASGLVGLAGFTRKWRNVQSHSTGKMK